MTLKPQKSLTEFDSDFRSEMAKKLSKIEKQTVDPIYISLSVCITTKQKEKILDKWFTPHTKFLKQATK